MNPVRAVIGQGLRWAGRRAGLVMATGILLGLALPPLAALFSPLLAPAIIAMLALTLMRLAPQQMVAVMARPLPLALLLAWVLLVMPLLAKIATDWLDVVPWLADRMVLTAAAAPLLSAAGLALLFGLDAAMALTVTVLGSLLLPLTVPLIAALLLGDPLHLDPIQLAARLGAVIGFGLAVAAALRWLLGRERLTAAAPLVDGLMVTALVVFGLAAMDGVQTLIRAEPGQALDGLLGVFGLALGMQLTATLVFFPFGWRFAATAGLLSAFSNFGVVVASLGDTIDTSTRLFLGLLQLPIYLLPILQVRLWRRWQIVSPGGSADAG